MGIKATTCVQPCVKPFPKLMRGVKSGNIWLMTSVCGGTKVKAGENDTHPDMKIGHHHEGVFSILEDYNEPLTLQNE
jgi:hypothetical protein